MGNQLAAFYISLFLGQAEKGEQMKKGAPKWRKMTGASPSLAKKAKKDPLPPPPEDVEEAEDQPEVQADLQSELAISSILRSPTTSADLLGS